MKLQYQKFTFLLFLLLITYSASVKAQTPTVQDCLGAIPVCGGVYTETNAYQNTGNYPNEINNGTSCLKSGEKNDVWYVFTVQASGILNFSITPNQMSDDYDWALYNLTNNSCSDIYGTPSIEASCNYSGTPGITGPNGLGGAQNEPTLNVFAGEIFVLNVSQYTNSSQNGYTLDLTASTAEFFDDTPPEAVGMSANALCDASTVDCSFSEGIVCSTVSPADFSISGPGGPFTITAVNSDVCDIGGTYDYDFHISFSPALQMGDYVLTMNPHNGSAVTDNCGNSAIMGTLNFSTTSEYSLTYAKIDPTCRDYTDGIIDASLPGATGTILYSINGAAFINNNGLYTGLSSGVYNIKAQTANLCSAEADITINNPTSGYANAGNDDDVCNSDTYTMQGSYPGGGVGHWTCNSDNVTFTNEFFFLSQVQNVPLGKSTFIWAVDNGVCGNYVDSVIITRYNTATTVGNDDTVCGDEYSLIANNPYPGTGTWNVSPAGGIFTDITNYTTDVSSLQIGANTITWTANYGTCGTFSDDIIITTTVNPLSADAGADNRICVLPVSDYHLAGTVPALGTGTWTTNSGGVTFDNINDPTTWARNLPVGYNTLTWTVADGDCRKTDDVIITNGTEVIAEAGNDEKICDLTSYQLSGSQPGTGTGHWTTTTPGVTFNNANLYNATASNLPYANITFKWEMTEGACVTEDNVIITRNQPITADAGGNTPICISEYTMQANNPSPGIGRWVTTTPLVVIENETLFSTNVTHIGYGPNDFTWTITNGACVSTDNLVITKQVSIQAYASRDTVLCGASDYQLHGNLPLPAYGVWTASNAGITYNDQSLYYATASNLPPGETEFVWAITNGVCTTRDTVIVKNDELIIANAGSDIHLCRDTFQLNGNNPSSGYAVWTVTTPDVTFNSNSIHNAIAYNLFEGTNAFTWTITNGICQSTDEVYIIKDPLVEAIAGRDTSICETSISLLANTSFPGNGSWSAQNSTVNFSNSATNTVDVTNLQDGANNIYWTIYYRTCIDTDTIIVNKDIPILSQAGDDTHFCADNYQLNGNNPSEGYGYWQTSNGNVNISGESVFNATVSNIPEGQHTFTWTIVNGTCRNSDEVIFTHDAMPTANAGNDFSICDVTTYTMAGNNPAQGTGVWQTSTSGITISQISTYNSEVTNLPEGQSTFTWTIYNGTCQHSDQVIITRDTTIHAYAGNDEQICDQTNYTFSANPQLQGTGTWTTTSSLDISSLIQNNSTINNLPQGEYDFIWQIVNGVCSDDDIITLKVDFTPSINLGNDVDICIGNSHTFDAGSEYDTYQWQDGATGSTYQANESGSYSVTVTNVCGNGSDEAKLTVHNLPEVKAGDDITICEADAVKLDATGEGDLEWQNPNASQNEDFYPTSSGEYIVKAKSEYDCENTDTLFITVNQRPAITFIDKETNGQFELDVDSEAEPLTYVLNDTLTQNNGLFNNLETGTYKVEITDQKGCKRLEEIYVYVEIPVIIPTIFTPNGDGINDTWEIKGLQQFTEGTIYIFDRNGKLINKYNIQEEGWDGTYFGTPIKPDTYWYVIETNTMSFKGYISLKK